MEIIDPHLHLFNLTLGKYAWLRAECSKDAAGKAPICRDFSERDLLLHKDLKLAGYVHIEAGFDNEASWREVDWLESHAKLPLRSVGHLNLNQPPFEFSAGLDQLAQRTSVVGIRHIFESPFENLVTHPNTLENLELLAAREMHFELQVETLSEENTAQIKALIRSYPKLLFVLNHAGFAPIAPNHKRYHEGLAGLRALSTCSNLCVKASGFEMADRQFSLKHAASHVARLCDYFDVQRVMLASNFPLIRLRMSYHQYWSEISEALEREKLPVNVLVHENAKRLYRFADQ